MNKKIPFLIHFGLYAAGYLAWLCPALADVVQADDNAYRMAQGYVAKGFAMTSQDNKGIQGAGGVVQFLIPVNKGLDYVFLAGGDDFAKDIDLYVYDEVGGLILDDRRRVQTAGVQFRSPYNGTALVYLHMARADGLASWSVLVGRRGFDKANAIITPQQGNVTAPNVQGGQAPTAVPSSTPSSTPAGP
jgi:hypothetical protein